MSDRRDRGVGTGGCRLRRRPKGSVCVCMHVRTLPRGVFCFLASAAVSLAGVDRNAHRRVRARSAVQESQRTSGGTLGGTREERLAHGRGIFLQKMQKMRRAVVAVAAWLQLGLFVALACLETHFLSLNVMTFA